MGIDGIGASPRAQQDGASFRVAGPHLIEIDDARFHVGLVNGSAIAFLLWLGLFLTVHG